MPKTSYDNTAAPVAVTNALTLLKTFNTKGADTLAATITVAVHDLNAFVIKGKTGASAPELTLFSSAASYTSPSGFAMITATGDLTVQAAASSGAFFMNLMGLSEVSLYASSASATGTTVAVFGALR